MIDILLEYPLMRFKRKVAGKMPVSWQELSQTQFIAISRMIDGADPDYRFLSVMTGIRSDLLKKLSAYELLKLSEGIDFIGRADNSYSDFIIKELPWGHLTAPKSKLSGLTFGQFIFADAYYNDWCQLLEETSLNKFIACLYLVPGEIFNHENIEKQIIPIGKIDLAIRKAIVLNYALISIWLQKAYPLIFVDHAESTSREDPPKPQSSGWVNLFESLVGEDLINRDRYAALPLHTVLRHLTKKFKENARK